MKYIIDICDEPINHCEGLPTIYRAKNFNSLVFDEEDLKRLTPYIPFEKEEQAWALAGRILSGYYSESDLVKMFGDNDPKYAITAYSYREAKIITDDYDNNRKIKQDVAKILEKTHQCLCRSDGNKCPGDCGLCDCQVDDDETIKALEYVLSMLREG